MDGLLNLLAKSGVGCLVGECYVWTLAYADDIVLLVPTVNAMRHMLKYVIFMLVIIALYLTHQNRNVFLFSHAAISLRPLVLNQSFFIGINLI